ncbi:MAG TPA: hypothetical protein VKD72_03285, partial [Gemmataceae bacterium]|nr:hypothetical protein [Gemmataceae bacterium]
HPGWTRGDRLRHRPDPQRCRGRGHGGGQARLVLITGISSVAVDDVRAQLREAEADLAQVASASPPDRW